MIRTLLLLLLSSACYAQGTWTTLGIPHSGRHDDIYFLNKNLGWAAGGGLKKIYKTENGGTSWKDLGTFPEYLRAIEFFDENIGFCGSLNNYFYKTTNGGQTWTNIAPALNQANNVTLAGVCGLAKADENTMYGVGVYYGPAFVIKTTDKGNTWKYIDMSQYATSLVDVFFFDANKGFVTGSKNDEEGGVVLYTEDGGQTWKEKIKTGMFTDRIWKIQTPDNVNFYGSVENLVEWWGDGTQQIPTRIIKSKDKGQTWEIVTVSNDFYYCQTVGFLDDKLGWTGGRATLFQTTNGGSTWEKVEIGNAYNRFTKIDHNTALISGNRIYKFTRDNVTGIKDEEPYDPVHTIEISPNPTNGQAKARVNFGSKTFADVYIYSPSGKRLQSLNHGYVEAGVKEFNIDVSTLPAQTLVLIVKTNEGLVTKKFLKL